MAALKFLWSLMISRRAAVVLLVAIVMILVLGASLPNPNLIGKEYSSDLKERRPFIYWLGERYNSKQLARGYLFGVIGVFLVLSTLFCSIDRILTRRKAKSSFMYPLHPGEAIECARERHEVEGIVCEWMDEGRWRTIVRETGGETLVGGSKGNAGFWGSIAFHALLITVLIGLVVYQLAGFRGTLVFLEGDEFRLEADAFTSMEKVPIWGMTFPETSLGLIRHKSEYAPEKPFVAVDHTATFRITDLVSGASTVRDVKVNVPVSLGGVDYILTSGGYAPRVVVREHGEPVYDGFVLMRIGENHLSIPGRPDLEAMSAFFADMVHDAGTLRSRSMELSNPNISFRMNRDGESVFKDVIPLGGSAASGDLRVDFPELRRWVLMSVVDEPGIDLFFYATFLGILGVIVRTVDPDRKVVAVISSGDGGSGSICRVASVSAHFSAINEEALGDLKARIRGGSDEV